MVYHYPNFLKNHQHCPRDFLDIENTEVQTILEYTTANPHRPHKNIHLNDWLKDQHRELYQIEHYVRGQNIAAGNQNYALANMTAIISRGDRTQDLHTRVAISFPIKMSTLGFSNIYTFEELVGDCRSELGVGPGNIAGRNLAQNYLHDLFAHGKNMIGVDTCGVQQPNFNDHSHDQFTKHSENIMLASLCTRKGVDYVLNRLSGEIRSLNYAAVGENVKIYALILHIHSTKMPCGVCETSLAGFQHSHIKSFATPRNLFLEKLHDRLIERSFTNPITPIERRLPLVFSYPGQNKPRPAQDIGIRLQVTMTANKQDRHHQYVVQGGRPQLEIRTLDRSKILIGDIQTGDNFNDLPPNYEPDLFQRAIFVSGGENSKDSPNTKQAGQQARNGEDKNLEGLAARLFT
jgi:hypothetical protein